MKISVLIPAYNCATKIAFTLDSVLRQTAKPYEILVMDDGSTDETAAVLDSYAPRITVYRQPNRGLPSARNELLLSAKADTDLIAYLDSDDIWHPRYLEAQREVFQHNPDIAASFMAHVNFYGEGDYAWSTDPIQAPPTIERIPALEFFKRYNRATGPFSCFSYCCVPLQVLQELGPQPFKKMGCEDSYCLSLMSLLERDFVLASAPLVAYRVTAGSMSHDHSKSFGVWVNVFEILEDRFNDANASFRRAFRDAFATKRRSYAKFLLGTQKTEEARRQLQKSLANSSNPASVVKSFGTLALSYLPGALQPRWPSSQRQRGAKPWKWWRWKANRG